VVCFIHQVLGYAYSAEARNTIFTSNVEQDCSAVELRIRDGGIADSLDGVFQSSIEVGKHLHQRVTVYIIRIASAPLSCSYLLCWMLLLWLPSLRHLLGDACARYYNFIKPHQALKGLTPSEKAGIEIGSEDNKWLRLIKQSIKQN